MSSSKSKKGASSAVLDAANAALGALAAIAPLIPLPFFQTAVGAAKHIVKAIETMRANQQDCNTLVLRVASIMNKVNNLLAGKSANDISGYLKDNVEKLMLDLHEIRIMLAKINTSTNPTRFLGLVKSILLYSRYTAMLKDCIGKLDWAMTEFQIGALLDQGVVLRRLEEDNRLIIKALDKISETNDNIHGVVKSGFHDMGKYVDQTWLDRLPRVAAASCLSSECPVTTGCFAQTRVAVLKQIKEWVGNTDPSTPCIYWLNGLAGIGKSTIAYTVSQEAYANGSLGASFFFSRRGEAGLRNCHRVFPTVAYQLAILHPALAIYIKEALVNYPNAFEANLDDQFKLLIAEPLQKVRGFNKTLVLAFDALDECNDSKEIKKMMHLLSVHIPKLPFPLKVLATSRPESLMNVTFNQLHSEIFVLHNIETSVVQDDIYLYLRSQLAEIPGKLGLSYQAEWITQKDLDELVKRAGRLFIYAATTVRFIENEKVHNPKQLLQILLSSSNNSVENDPYSELDQLYLALLLNTLDNSTKKSNLILQKYQTTVGTLVLLRDSLPLSALTKLAVIGLEAGQSMLEYISDALHSLQSVILISGEHVEVYHPSFPDFIRDPHRCTDQRFLIDQNEHECQMAINCFRLMDKHLKRNLIEEYSFNMFNTDISDLETRLLEQLPLEAQYACKFWASHAANTQEKSSKLEKYLNNFAFQHALWWLEAMSLLKEIPLAITSMETITKWAGIHDCSSKLQEMLHDIHRFTMINGDMIRQSFCHIYLSALPFTPKKTLLYRHYQFETKGSATVLIGTQANWSRQIHVFIGHTNDIASVAFSPDGSIAASSSYDWTVRLWDTKSGACTATLKGHTMYVGFVSFSSDGTILASGAADYTVRLWDINSGTSIGILDGHSAKIMSLSFAPSGYTLASCSKDRTVKIWDAKSATCIATWDHSDSVYDIAYSPDGLQLVSCSDAVKLWNVKYGSYVTITEHTANIAKFSPNGSLLATPHNYAIKLWDTRTGASVATLQENTVFMNSIAFSPDGSILASCSRYNNTIKLWNISSATCFSTTLNGHLDFVNSVAFSPDGLMLASCSQDQSVRLWDVKSGALTATMQNHSDVVTQVAFSPDGSSLISGSEDQTVRLWDVKSDTSTSESQGHSNYIFSVAISPNGSTLASCSADKTIRLWDMTSGTTYVVTDDHLDIKSVEFSPDGEILASCSNYSVKLWETSSGKAIGKLSDYGDAGSFRLNFIVFSKNGLALLTCFGDKNFELWNAKSGFSMTRWQDTDANSVSISSDGTIIASCSKDTAFKLWSAKSSTAMTIMKGHTGSVLSIAFSPHHSSILASCSEDQTVRLWDIESDTAIAILYGHSKRVISVAFSPDGSLLASCSDDKTVRLWDTKSTATVSILSYNCGCDLSLSFSSDLFTLSGTRQYEAYTWLINHQKLGNFTNPFLSTQVMIKENHSERNLHIYIKDCKLFAGFDSMQCKPFIIFPPFLKLVQHPVFSCFWPYIAVGCVDGQVLVVKIDEIFFSR